MNMLEWRKEELRCCLYELVPLVLKDFANKCQLELKEWNYAPITKNYTTYGFHFSNIILLNWILEGQQKLTVKLPVPNEDDLFVVNDSYRIFTNELPDKLLSFRFISDSLLMRWQGSLTAIVCDEKGQVRILSEKYPLWLLFTSVFSEDELRQLELYFEVDKKNGQLSLQSNKDLKINLPTKFSLLTPLQQLVVTSYIHTPSIKKPQDLKRLVLSSKAIEYIENSLLDPITRYIYSVNNLKELLLYTIKSLEGKTKTVLVGSNLEFKRIRSYELIIISLYEKLKNIVKQTKHQKKIHVAPDFLLKKMFVEPTLQRLFEYFNRANVFQEVALRFKIVVPLEHVPYDLRDVHSSFYGNICIYDTPDDEGIGVKLQLSPDCNLEKFGFFILKT